MSTLEISWSPAVPETSLAVRVTLSRWRQWTGRVEESHLFALVEGDRVVARWLDPSTLAMPAAQVRATCGSEAGGALSTDGRVDFDGQSASSAIICTTAEVVSLECWRGTEVERRELRIGGGGR